MEIGNYEQNIADSSEIHVEKGYHGQQIQAGSRDVRERPNTSLDRNSLGNEGQLGRGGAQTNTTRKTVKSHSPEGSGRAAKRAERAVEGTFRAVRVAEGTFRKKVAEEKSQGNLWREASRGKHRIVESRRDCFEKQGTALQNPREPCYEGSRGGSPVARLKGAKLPSTSYQAGNSFYPEETFIPEKQLAEKHSKRFSCKRSSARLRDQEESVPEGRHINLNRRGPEYRELPCTYQELCSSPDRDYSECGNYPFPSSAVEEGNAVSYREELCNGSFTPGESYSDSEEMQYEPYEESLNGSEMD